MAALKSIANHAAAFLVVPLTGGLLVWSTFLIGRRLGSDRLGLAAAWLVATISSYCRWLVETQTPFVIAGVGILAIAPSRLSPAAHDRAAMRLLAWLTVMTWAVYAAHPAFDAWWFLRFLLPSWPAMFIGTAALIIWLFDHRGARARASTVVVVIALGAYGLVVTAQRHVFVRNEGERRYATIAHLVARQTETVRNDICLNTRGVAALLRRTRDGSIRFARWELARSRGGVAARARPASIRAD